MFECYIIFKESGRRLKPTGRWKLVDCYPRVNIDGARYDQILKIEHRGIFRNKWVDEREIEIIREYTCGADHKK
jgi:hypothetical protein